MFSWRKSQSKKEIFSNTKIDMTKKEKWDVFIGLFGVVTIILSVVSFYIQLEDRSKADEIQKEKDLEEKKKWRLAFQLQNEKFIQSKKEFESSITNISQALNLSKEQDVLERKRAYNLTLIEPYQNLLRSLETIRLQKPGSSEYKMAADVIRFSSEALITIINDGPLKYLHNELKKTIDLGFDIDDLTKLEKEYYYFNLGYVDSVDQILNANEPINNKNFVQYKDLRKKERELNYSRIQLGSIFLFGKINASYVNSKDKYSIFYSDIKKNDPVQFFNRIDGCTDSLLQYVLNHSNKELLANNKDDSKQKLFISRTEFYLLNSKFIQSFSNYLLSIENKTRFIAGDLKERLELKNPFLNPK